MKKPDYAQWKTHKKVKGFSLTELVIVIIIIAILALAVFAGGSASIKKAQLSRATSDLNNFNIAIETYMFSNRDPVKLKNSSTKSEFDSITDGLNKVLPQDYKLEKSKTIPQTGNIYSTLTDQIVYQSAKEDPWGNPYYFLMDMQARNAGNTEYFFTVLSAGPNAKANVGGEVDKDDIFLLSQYMNGTVESQIYSMKTDTKDGTGSPLTKGETTLSSLTGKATPRNLGPNAKDVPHTHTYTVDSKVEPTCSKAGTKNLRCTICGDKKQETISKTAHSFSEWRKTTAATCTTNGKNTRTCSACGYKETQNIPMLGHSYGDWTTVTAATCTAGGEEKHTCTRPGCGEYETRETDSLGGHIYGEWTTVTAATCTVGGTEKRTCTRTACTASETRNTNPIGHDYETNKYIANSDGTTHSKVCSRNPAHIESTKEAHTWNAGVVTKPPTYTETGIKTYTCTKCSKTKTENIPVINKLESIAVTTAPTKTTYKSGESFSTAGMVVTATYTDGTTKAVTGYTVTNGTNLTVGKTYVTISYTEDGVTKTTTQSISVPTPPTLAEGSYWWSQGTSRDRSIVKTINIVDSYTPTGNESESWDASYGKKGTITAYLESDKLTIAGNGAGSIYANSRSAGAFKYFTRVTTINGLEMLDTSNVTNMSGMFEACSAMTTPPNVSNWNTSNVTDMYEMFYQCSAMTTPPNTSNWNTSNVINMSRMFSTCMTMTTPPNTSNWDTSKVTKIAYMFANCWVMTTPPNVSNWNTSNVTEMGNMFEGCRAIKTPPDTSNWNTSKVTYMGKMFYECKAMTTCPNTSGWDTSKVIDMSYMFARCKKLTTLDIRSFNTCSITSATNLEYFADACGGALKYIKLGENFGQSGKIPSSGLFYSAPTVTTQVYGANSVMQAYNWTGDHRTPVFMSY